jgi:hypothetical protein
VARAALRTLAVVGAVIVVLAAVAQAAAASPARAAATCPGTFQVLHDDRIGALRLPAGPYRIATRGGLGCAQAAIQFASFLQDWDGVLPGGWRVNAAQSSFVRSGGPVGFTVRRVGGGGGSTCAGAYTVLRPDRIGPVQIPSGNYQISLGSSRNTCVQAASLLSQFLDGPGTLPSPWTLDPTTGTFMRGNTGTGFRILLIGSATGGGGRHPAAGTSCPGTFRVLHNDRIGSLRFPAGPYIITTLRGGGLSCSRAATLFVAFLQRPDGSLPRPWLLNAAYARFTQGRRSSVGFQVEPAGGSG